MHEKRTLSVQRFENTLTRNDFFVDLTIYDIPVSLLEDFSEYIIKPVYDGEVVDEESEAEPVELCYARRVKHQ